MATSGVSSILFLSMPSSDPLGPNSSPPGQRLLSIFLTFPATQWNALNTMRSQQMLPTDWLMYKRAWKINQPKREPARIFTNWQCVIPHKMLVYTLFVSLAPDLLYLLWKSGSPFAYIMLIIYLKKFFFNLLVIKPTSIIKSCKGYHSSPSWWKHTGPRRPGYEWSYLFMDGLSFSIFHRW